uniref:Alanine--tRNA ligase n=1 Tax=uncultured bacterium UPO53 TaxID=1776978 RepID=A0A126SYJ4_9BACT|nr:aspartate kinase [uncultured bacterium UPO53]
MKSAAIREAFLCFFEEKGHTRVASSSLIPANDPTLLFTNAGMNQFKDCFLGLDKRAYTRAVSSQKCVRAGGKHNDLENVGYTARHHTFFEMLGNFSFGDYFKRDAIHYAWEFLTSSRWLAIPTEKLWVTVYATDDEAYGIWKDEIGVPAARIIRIGDNKGAPYASDNFWAMGDTGPCGPCTEIFYDHGPDVAGGPPGSPEEDGDRYIEIWNNVFMQFNRTADGVLHPLPAPSVDTGMGLERISAVMQHVHSNYEIDLFQRLLNAAAEAIGCRNEGQPSLKVVADHIRSCSFLIADGVQPSNEGRGYVLRRIIRRACRHGNKLGASGPFFYRIVAALAAEMGEAYPELKTQQAVIERALKLEEEQFAKTLEQGLKLLEQELAGLKGSVIPGSVVFKLYDTYGFPDDLTGDIARERGLSLDMAGFEQAMRAQRERSQEAGKFDLDYNTLIKVDGDTRFTGYEGTQGQGRVVSLFRGAEKVEALSEGEQGVIVLDSTPFYGESGGQVGDTGYLDTGVDGKAGRFEVRDTTKAGGAHLHHGVVTRGTLRVGDEVRAQVDAGLREATRRNHSATHLMHAALRQILGTHVQQKGSLVCADYLRFDFSQPEAIKPEQLNAIEALVNAEILANQPVQTEIMAIDDARKKGAMALFGEKYGDTVRVLSMGTPGFSIELCGGTHVSRTGDIGLFKITSEGGVASGVRRIEAKTGTGALAHVKAEELALGEVAAVVRAPVAQAAEKVRQLAERNRELEKELERLKMKLAASAGDELLNSAVSVGPAKVLAARLDGVDPKSLRDTMDQLRNKLGSSVVVLSAVADGKVSLVVGVSADLTAKVKAGELVNFVAQQVGGKGGGRPDMAQAGGTEAAKLPEALQSVQSFVAERI